MYTKTLIPLLSFSFNFAEAGLSKIQNELENYANSSFIKRLNYRATGDYLHQGLTDLVSGYGCWCHFDGEGLPLHHGRPLDWWDGICKDLSHGYKCGMIETSNCVPWEVDYIVGTSGGEANLVSMCDQYNQDECAKIACKVEGQFVQD